MLGDGIHPSTIILTAVKVKASQISCLYRAAVTTADCVIWFRNPKEGTFLLHLPYLVLKAMMDLIL